MGRTLIKPDKDDDFYVIYSSIVDLPVFWGSRKKMLKNSKKNWDSKMWLPKPEDLDAIDQGTHPLREATEVVWNNQGELPVSRLKEACKMLDKGLDPMDPKFRDMLDLRGWDLSDEV